MKDKTRICRYEMADWKKKLVHLITDIEPYGYSESRKDCWKSICEVIEKEKKKAFNLGAKFEREENITKN